MTPLCLTPIFPGGRDGIADLWLRIHVLVQTPIPAIILHTFAIWLHNDCRERHVMTRCVSHKGRGFLYNPCIIFHGTLQLKGCRSTGILTRETFWEKQGKIKLMLKNVHMVHISGRCMWNLGTSGPIPGKVKGSGDISPRRQISV